MAQGKLFEFAVLFHPKAQKDTAGNDTTPPSEIISEPTTVIAVTEKEVAMRAARSIPAKYEAQLEQVEIIVRPF